MTIQKGVFVKTVHRADASGQVLMAPIRSSIAKVMPPCSFARIRNLKRRIAKDKSAPDPARTTKSEFKCVLQTFKDTIGVDPTKWSSS